MREKCQCGKPEYMRIHTNIPVGIHHWDTLHFKAADRYCERCGAPLCGECSIDIFYDWNHYLCRTCAELEME